MTRKSFLAILFLLGAIEAGVLLTGWHNRHKPDPATVIPPAGFPNRALPERLATPTLFVEPGAGYGWVYALIGGAKQSIDMTMYELVDTTFSADLVQACQRGVKVRVILDQSLEKQSNTPAFNQLAAAGPNCSVAWSNPQFQATHQKTLIIDLNKAVVMTFNLASRYYSSSRDMALISTDVADIAAIDAAFEKDFGSTTDITYDPASAHDLIWSPTTAQDDLLSLINGAKKTLLVENEELGAANIVSALSAACKRGVDVKLAMTDTSMYYHTNFQALQAAGCGVHIGANNATTLYVHAKAMVADLGTPDAIGYVGSINFSIASMTRNRELGLYVHDANNLSQIANTITSDFNQFPSFTPTAASENMEPARP